MIRSITVINCYSESLYLKLDRPEDTGIAVTSITGLGPGAADVNTTEIASNDGSLFNSSRLPQRNIVITTRFVGYDIEADRHKTYKYFPIKRKLTLIIETDSKTVSIDGYVESNEPEIFSEEEGAEISIICPYPFFYLYGDNAVQTTNFSTVSPNFEFEFSNESLEDPLIELSEISTETEKVISYDGDSEIGFLLRISFAGSIGDDLVFADLDTNEMFTIDNVKIGTMTDSRLKSGDVIEIVTEKGKKSATLIRDAERINILNSIPIDSDWFVLKKGYNRFSYLTDSGMTNMKVVIENRTIYDGV